LKGRDKRVKTLGQLEQVPAPAAEYVPALQAVQLEEAVDMVLETCFPAAQLAP